MKDKNVIKLDDYRPHDTFNAVCIGCGYSWQVGIDARHEGMLECPECGAMAGKEVMEEAMTDEVEPIECNIPELTACNCELGRDGKIPTALQRLECKMRGDGCRETCTEPNLTD